MERFGFRSEKDPNHWLNEDGTIRRLNTYFKKELTEQQKAPKNMQAANTTQVT